MPPPPPCCARDFCEFSHEILSCCFAVFMAFLFLVSFLYMMYSIAVTQEMKITLYSACESSAEWAGAIKRIQLEICAVHVYPTCVRLVWLVLSIYSSNIAGRNWVHRDPNNCRSSDNVRLQSAHLWQNLNFGRTLCPDKFFFTKQLK